MKTIFKCKVCGDIHWGVSAPEVCPTCENVKVYEDSDIETVNILLTDSGLKKLYRCIVCNDLHIGVNAPKVCPTCFNNEVYVEINGQEFDILINNK